MVMSCLLNESSLHLCLQWISETMQLPPAVAGVTLLSFAGGAPDLFTQLAAVSTVVHTQFYMCCCALSSKIFHLLRHGRLSNVIQDSRDKTHHIV